ncbi:MAG: hypothetical protein UX04_C0001G0121 [Microgenomates group bacterium GW2011_GWF2_45_18]|nr:MAG: hypothetical protein UW18_C0003G0109 [Microgenomates group bacterium GW2011_GWF1_44_10]KKU02350.1 MAG: hypothetical protein UX04_C0001G0121 [Microgenomates group bacterium GW2011_GWF2_45_18]OGJ41682.1 MAG: hypothetical protein A2378_02255 [Candidatus Pacebacteria bacterium RIFOXYB1_FULL_44_10]HAU99183.1 hypothetical protein [Candidatus Paceibacterota bacterium]HAX01713.1 hypothetical protein [Candidatus Paceibacterota bacterium]
MIRSRGCHSITISPVMMCGYFLSLFALVVSLTSYVFVSSVGISRGAEMKKLERSIAETEKTITYAQASLSSKYSLQDIKQHATLEGYVSVAQLIFLSPDSSLAYVQE